MSVFNLKSTVLSNRDAVPKFFSDGFLMGGKLGETIGSVKTGSPLDNAGSQYRCFQIPSNARIVDLQWQADALGSSCKLDVAVWYPTTVQAGGANFLAPALAGTLISSSLFATALTPTDPGTTTPLTVITNQSLNYTIPSQELPLWAALGLLADPELPLDIGFTVRIANTTQGYVGLKARYAF